MKDPAVMLYIDKWMLATKSMPPEAKGWYLNLILIQYDRGGELPNDIEELALICDVRFSQFDLFKQTWEQVLKQKFNLLDNGNLQNPTGAEILRKRELFKEKRSGAGTLGYIIKVARCLGYNDDQILLLKNDPDTDSFDTKNKQVLEQVLKQKLKLYINIDIDTNTPLDVNGKRGAGKKPKYSDEFENFWNAYNKKGSKSQAYTEWEELTSDEQAAAVRFIPAYFASKPDIQFRKDAERYLKNKTFEDAIALPPTQTEIEKRPADCYSPQVEPPPPPQSSLTSAQREYLEKNVVDKNYLPQAIRIAEWANEALNDSFFLEQLSIACGNPKKAKELLPEKAFESIGNKKTYKHETDFRNHITSVARILKNNGKL